MPSTHPEGPSRLVAAFIEGRPHKIRNGETDGHTIYLHGNPIAKRVAGGIQVADCGWPTATTRRWLSLLPGVRVNGHKGAHLLNGKEWDGSPTLIPSDLPEPTGTPGTAWDMSEHCTDRSDAWRPVFMPVHAVAGANDTGKWSDSPCPSDTATAELEAVKAALSKAGIPTRDKVLNSSNVFMVRRFVVVRPCDAARAREIVSDMIEGTTLLYPVQ